MHTEAEKELISANYEIGTLEKLQQKLQKKGKTLNVEQTSKLEELREKVIELELEYEEKFNQELEQENIEKDLKLEKEKEKDEEIIMKETKIIDNTTQFDRIRDWIVNFKYIDIITKQQSEIPSDLDEVSWTIVHPNSQVKNVKDLSEDKNFTSMTT